jgi:predicted Holliday junction resolvase-like endonuclease
MFGWILALILFVCLVIVYFYFKGEIGKLEMNFEYRVTEEIKRKEKEIREDAIKRSSSIRVGKEIERLIPFTSDFPYDPRDVRWLGDPIDLVIFDGYGESRDTGNIDKLNKIVICEVKTGKSRIGKYERVIKELIEDKKVEWGEFRVREHEKES